MNIIDVPFTNGTYSNGTYSFFSLTESSVEYDISSLSYFLLNSFY